MDADYVEVQLKGLEAIFVECDEVTHSLRRFNEPLAAATAAAAKRPRNAPSPRSVLGRNRRSRPSPHGLKTWRYVHHEERFAFVELAFQSDGRIEARNKLSSTTGRYEVHDDMLCATYESRGWGRNCYYVLDDGGDALKLQSLSVQRTVGFEVCTEASCIPATRANISQPSQAAQTNGAGVVGAARGANAQTASNTPRRLSP